MIRRKPIARKALVLTRDIDHSPRQHRWGPCPSQIWQTTQFGPIRELASIRHECTWILEFLSYNQRDSKCPTAYSCPYQNIERSFHTWGRFVHWALQISARKWHYYINHFWKYYRNIKKQTIKSESGNERSLISTLMTQFHTQSDENDLNWTHGRPSIFIL